MGSSVSNIQGNCRKVTPRNRGYYCDVEGEGYTTTLLSQVKSMEECCKTNLRVHKKRVKMWY